jgi:hypothetical protein
MFSALSRTSMIRCTSPGQGYGIKWESCFTASIRRVSVSLSTRTDPEVRTSLFGLSTYLLYGLVGIHAEIGDMRHIHER